MLETVFLYVWGITGVILVIGSLFSAGYWNKEDERSFDNIFLPAFIAAVVWPFVLALAITGGVVCAPFYAIYYIGNLIRRIVDGRSAKNRTEERSETIDD